MMIIEFFISKRVIYSTLVLYFISYLILLFQGTENIQGIFLDLFEIQIELHLQSTSFRKMHNLRLLKIHDSSYMKKDKLRLQDLQYLPHSLRYLEWHGYPLKSLPPKFNPVNLVELKMPYSQLEQLWDGVQVHILQFVVISSHF